EEPLDAARRSAQKREGDEAALLRRGGGGRQAEAAERRSRRLAAGVAPSQPPGGRIQVRRHGLELLDQAVTGVPPGVDLVEDVGEDALGACTQQDGAAIRREEGLAALRICDRVVRASANAAAVVGTGVLVLAALRQLEVARPRHASLGVGGRVVGAALARRALGRRRAARALGRVHARSRVPEVGRAGGAVAADERRAGADVVGAAVVQRARVFVVTRAALGALALAAAALVAGVDRAGGAVLAVVVGRTGNAVELRVAQHADAALTDARDAAVVAAAVAVEWLVDALGVHQVARVRSALVPVVAPQFARLRASGHDRGEREEQHGCRRAQSNHGTTILAVGLRDQARTRAGARC